MVSSNSVFVHNVRRAADITRHYGADRVTLWLSRKEPKARRLSSSARRCNCSSIRRGASRLPAIPRIVLPPPTSLPLFLCPFLSVPRTAPPARRERVDRWNGVDRWKGPRRSLFRTVLSPPRTGGTRKWNVSSNARRCVYPWTYINVRDTVSRIGVIIV